MLKDGQLDFSQARVLLTLQNPDQVFKVARQALEKHLSVIQLGVRVSIRDRRGKGKIVIEYSSLDDFDRVLEMLKGKNH